VSPAEQPIEIRVTLTQTEAVDFLERLAHDEEFRRSYQENPITVLAENGIEISPPDAIPSTIKAPRPEDLEEALEALKIQPLWPWIGRFIPWVGLLALPEDDEG
jgi:hypothetical protein